MLFTTSNTKRIISNNRTSHQVSLLRLLLAICLTPQMTYLLNQIPAIAAAAASASAASPPGSNTNAGSDIFYIRHGRSRVRHSNEKDHFRRGLQAAFTNITLADKGSPPSDDYNEAPTGIEKNVAAFGSSISSGNEQLFDSDFWQNSDTNDTLLSMRELVVPPTEQSAPHTQAPTPTPDVVSTQAPVTHKIRKLHKKKIMESIRRSVADKRVKLSKNHRSLAEAEHRQGRLPEALDEVSNDDVDADDELLDDIELETAAENRNGYQNDVYLTTLASTMTSSPTGSSFVTFEPDVSGIENDSQVDEFEDDDEEEQKNEGGQQIENFIQKSHMMDTTAVAVTTERTHAELSKLSHANSIKAAMVNVGAVAKNISFVNNDENVVTTIHKNQQELQQQVLDSWSSKHMIKATVYDSEAGNSLIEVKTKPEDSTESDYNVDELSTHKEENYVEADVGREQSLHAVTSEKPTKQRSDAALVDYESVSDEPNVETSPSYEWGEAHSLGPSHLASTSVGGISLDRQQSIELEEINFDDVGADNSQDTMDDGIIDNRNDNRFSVNSGDAGAATTGSDDDIDETNKFLEGVVDAANEDEIYDWDEISRSNRRNLMRGRDVVTKFLQIVETQHSLGSNCEAGTSLNLGEGVVDRYAQDRFRVEAEVAVNRANMLTRIFKMTSPSVQSSVNLLHASVLSMVEFDDDIFAAGNCFDWNQHPSQPGLFCPFAYRLPPPNLGAIFAKDLATEYHYLGNTSEWFFQARKNAEKVIARNEQYLKAFHLYSNKTDERIEMDTLAVKYEDGRWSKPYYDCGGGNIWMLTYTVPFFGYENGTYIFKGTSGIDIDLRRVDIDQCPQRSTPGTTQPLNIFAGTDKCKQRTTMCEALKGLGFRRGSYKCLCRKGYYFPDTLSMHKFFNGSLLEEEYEKLMLGKNSTYNIVAEYECLPCAEGCDSCEDGSPCIAALNWPMRTSILVLACTVIGLLPPAAWFTFRYQQVKVVRAASPALLRVIALGAFFIYCTTIVMYPNPNLYTCTARIWLREIGFSLTYGALMLKTWRISVIFRVRSAKAVKITDAALLKRLGIICGVIGTCLLVRTLVSPPEVVVGRTADDLKAFLCKTDWWDYTFTSMEVLFLAWGVRLCIMVRKAPSEFNESRFISMAIYNEFLLTCFLNVSMLFLQSPANPDLLYIIFFCHTQLTVTLLLGLIFGSKVYIVLRSGKSHQESIGMGTKQSGAKFNFRPQVRTFANPSSVTTSTAQMGGGTTSAETKLSDQEALEEIRQLSVQLQRIQEMAPPKGVAVMTISSLLDGLKTPGGMMMVAAAAGSTAVNQLTHKQQPAGSLPLLALGNDMHKYNHQLQLPAQNNNLAVGDTAISGMLMASPPPPPPIAVIAITLVEKSVNTSLSGEDFQRELLASQAHVVCSRCLDATKSHYYTCRRPSTPTLCERMGSPQPEGSISFSNIKLDCMCSQPDDLDRQHDSTPTHTRRRVNYRTAATNTPPSSSTCRRRSKTKGGTRFHHGSSSSLSEAQKMSDAATATTTDSVVGGLCDTQTTQRSDSEIFQICDNCKNKLSSRKSSVKSSKLVVSQSKALKLDAPTKSITTTTKIASELVEHLPTTSSNTTTSVSKRLHSTDDVSYYTTTDDGSDADEITDSFCIRRRRHPQGPLELICQSTSALSSSTAMGPGIIETCSSYGPIVPSTSSSSIAGSCIAAATVETHATIDVSTTCHSDGNVSPNSNGSTNGNTGKSNGRSKRPDKLMLDLNDRSKYTKEVSV